VRDPGPLRRALTALAGGVLVLALAGCGTSGAAVGSTADQGFVSGDGGVTILAPDQRPAAPVVSGPKLGDDGATLSTDAWPGKVVVVNVWGSWCAPCRAEAPDLVEAADRTADVAAFVGLNTRDLDPAPAEAFVRSYGIGYPSIYDPSGRVLLEFSDQLPPSGIPSTLVIDQQGRVAARIIGRTTAATIVGVVTDVASGS